MRHKLRLYSSEPSDFVTGGISSGKSSMRAGACAMQMFAFHYRMKGGMLSLHLMGTGHTDTEQVTQSAAGTASMLARP